MRKLLKFLHTLGSCGLIGGLAGYAVLAVVPSESLEGLASARRAIVALCSWVLIPSLGLVLVSGLMSMSLHQPFHEQRWVWLKLLLGLSLFEATLGIVGSKAEYAATLAGQIVAGTATRPDLDDAVVNEWPALAVILAISVVSVALGVWRPALRKR